MAKQNNALLMRALREGDTHMRSGRLGPAIASFHDVLSMSPRNAHAFAGIGWAMGLRGENTRAAEHLKKAVAIDGTNPMFHFYLGTVQQRLGNAAEAMSSFQKSIALGPRQAYGYGAAAALYERLHKLDKAKELLEKGLEVAPFDTQIAANLWSIRARLGDAEEARRGLRKLVESIPANEPRDTMVRSYLLLGQLEDKLGDYDRAFECFSRMNQCRIEGLGERIKEGGQYLASFKQMHGLTREMAERWRDQGQAYDDGLADPIFLVGFPRSGTTMTEQILGSHPRVVASSEKPMLTECAREVEDLARGTTVPAALDALTRDHVLRMRRAYWESAAANGLVVGPGQLLLDKFPLHLARLSWINRLFPRARVLVALRDPRDCCLSGFMQSMQMNRAMMQFLTLDTSARLYASVMDLYLAERDKLTIALHQVRYEDTVADLEREARRMLEFFGLGWDEGVLSFYKRGREKYVTTPSYQAVTEPINKKAQGRWHKYRRHLEPILPVLAPYVKEYGYEPA